MRGADVEPPRGSCEILSRALNGTTLVSLVLVCLAAAAIGMVRRRIDLAVGAGLLVLGANASTQLLKIRLDRPDLDDFPAPNSFPSGHTTAAASVAFALILVLPFAIRGTVALIGAGVRHGDRGRHRLGRVAPAQRHRRRAAGRARLGRRASALVRAADRGSGSPVVERPGRTGSPCCSSVARRAHRARPACSAWPPSRMSERVIPDLVSGRFAFLAGAAGITAAVAGAFLIWVRLAAGDRPVSPRGRACRGGRRRRRRPQN